MSINDKQRSLLRQPIDMKKKVLIFDSKVGRALAGKPYQPVHIAVETANEIFDFEWSSEVMDCTEVFEHGPYDVERSSYDKTKKWVDQVWDVCYRCHVRVTASGVVHDGIGAHVAESVKSRGEAHENASMAAESVALKRALRKFGNQFGNSLADKDDPDGSLHADRLAELAGGTASPALSPPPSPSVSPKLSTPITEPPMAAPTHSEEPSPVAPTDGGITAEAVVEAVKEFKSRTGRLPKIAEERNLRTPSKFRALTPKQLGEVLQAIAAEEEGVN